MDANKNNTWPVITAETFQLCADLNWKKVEYPCIVEPKIDGVRCFVVVDDDGVVHPYTRSGREWTVIAPFLQELSQFPRRWFDGEIQIDGEWGPTNAAVHGKIRDGAKVEYTVFAGALDYLTHYELISTRQPEWCKCYNRAEVEAYYLECLRSGYEGVVVKLLGIGYTHGRSTAWMKLKPHKTLDVFVDGRCVELRDGTIIRERFDR